MGIWNDRKLIVNCLPLTESERAQFIRAAKDIPQEFVGDSTQRGSMSWTAAVPEELKAKATAVIGNIAPEECAQCPKLEWLQTWSAGVDKYQRPGILQPGSMLTNATGAYGQSVSEHMFAMMWAIMKNLHIYAASNPNAMWQDAGRGNAIESQALADALAEGRIRGAALDVTEPEPLPEESPLWREPRCLVTPHVAGGNHLESTERRIIAIALGNVRCYANGQPLNNLMPLKG